MTNALQIDCKLEIAGADVVIENLDIDFEIIKTKDSEPNKAKITVWNLSPETFNKVSNKTTLLRLYVSKYGEGFKLVFEGNPRDATRSRAGRDQRTRTNIKTSGQKSLKPAIMQGVNKTDIATILELRESDYNYQNAFINKSYKGSITSTQVINDLMSAYNLPVSHISSNIKTKTFEGGLVVSGLVKNKLDWICKTIGAKWSSQNGNIQILNKDEKFKTLGIALNSDNSEMPEELKENQVRFTTELLPLILPGDWLNADFRTIKGDYEITKHILTGNNYGTKAQSELFGK